MIILLLAVIATVVLVYLGFVRQPAPPTVGVNGAQLGISRIQSSFNINILNDRRLQNLVQYGPRNVEVIQRGRNADPFQPF